MWLGDDATGHLSPGDGPEDVPVGDGHGADPAAGHEHTPLPFDTITAVDLDGDGLLETMIVHDGEQITVSYDLDGDGATDYETVFDAEGHAVSWQDQRDPDGSRHWRRVSG